MEPHLATPYPAHDHLSTHDPLSTNDHLSTHDPHDYLTSTPNNLCPPNLYPAPSALQTNP